MPWKFYPSCHSTDTAFIVAGQANNFRVQVRCHREVQTALHRLYPHLFDKSNIHEYAFNCTVIQNPWAFENLSIGRLQLKNNN